MAKVGDNVENLTECYRRQFELRIDDGQARYLRKRVCVLYVLVHPVTRRAIRYYEESCIPSFEVEDHPMEKH